LGIQGYGCVHPHVPIAVLVCMLLVLIGIIFVDDMGISAGVHRDDGLHVDIPV